MSISPISPSVGAPVAPSALGTVSELHAKITLLQGSTLSAIVQQEIERAILSGEYEPGAKLTEASIAERLGISRGPIREAFRMLEEAGLVRTEKNRGVFVRSIPLDEAVEIFDLRAAMEEHVGRQLAEHIKPVELKEIRTLVDAMERAAKDKDARAYHLMNMKFHDRLVELASNRKLTALYRKLINELSLFRRINLSVDSMLPTSANEHRQIVKAIAAGDTQAAGKALYEHVMESKARTIEHEQARLARVRAVKFYG
jgi:phosphonate utilization transcriptional regulator